MSKRGAVVQDRLKATAKSRATASGHLRCLESDLSRAKRREWSAMQGKVRFFLSNSILFVCMHWRGMLPVLLALQCRACIRNVA